MPTRIPANLGETSHRLKSGQTKRFRPVGQTYRVIDARGAVEPLGPKNNPIERLGGGGLSARLFVGLSVGNKPTYSIDDVVKATIEARKAQGVSPDASFLIQRGVYTYGEGQVVTENSVQIILLDFEGRSKPAFTEDVTSLADRLREKLQQETVIVEIQERGVVQDVYSVTA